MESTQKDVAFWTINGGVINGVMENTEEERDFVRSEKKLVFLTDDLNSKFT